MRFALSVASKFSFNVSERLCGISNPAPSTSQRSVSAGLEAANYNVVRPMKKGGLSGRPFLLTALGLD
jgi:hypothetical protein